MVAAEIRAPAEVDAAHRVLVAVAAWGRQRPDVRAVLLVGSQARAEMPADSLVGHRPWATSSDWSKPSASAGEPQAGKSPTSEEFA